MPPDSPAFDETDADRLWVLVRQGLESGSPVPLTDARLSELRAEALVRD
jgi:hypothetical protein